MGLLTHPDNPNDPASVDVVSQLKASLNLSYLGIHHRLDREVSGALVFALRKEANGWLSKAFEGREAVKEYVAIVEGKLPARNGIIDTPLPAPKSGGKPVPALTRYIVERVAPDNRYSQVRLTLETGRTHQLRAHMAQVGCPIVGDILNGDSTHPVVYPRQLLHALRLILPVPDSEKLTITAPMPEVFGQVLQGGLLAEIETLTRQGIFGLFPRHLPGLITLLQIAQERRNPLSLDPAQDNTAFRLINEDGDGFPGITLDAFGNTLVLNLYDPQIRAGNSGFRVLLEAINKAFPGRPLYAKFRPLSATNLGASAPPPDIAPPLPLLGEPTPEINIWENGLNYLIRPGNGLSVGLFLDMRQMRERIEKWAEGKTVLNCFSYTCGFGVAAMAGGATRVLNLDVANPVLEWGKENYRANGLTPDDFDFVQGDVFDWLNRFGRKGEKFDIVILDPPSFSTTRQTRFAADKDYDMLATLAAKTVAPGGKLIACTNNARLERRIFRHMVFKGISTAGYKVSQDTLSQYEEPTLDFPHEGEGYLKIIVATFPSP